MDLTIIEQFVCAFLHLTNKRYPLVLPFLEANSYDDDFWQYVRRAFDDVSRFFRLKDKKTVFTLEDSSVDTVDFGSINLDHWWPVGSFDTDTDERYVDIDEDSHDITIRTHGYDDAGGDDIDGYWDILERQVEGDFECVVKLSSGLTGSYDRMGLCFLAEPKPGSSGSGYEDAGLYIKQGGVAYFKYDSDSDGELEAWQDSGATTYSLPCYLKLVRSGDVFTGYASSDGETWDEIGSRTFDHEDTVFLGIFAAGGVSGYRDNVFSDFSLTLDGVQHSIPIRKWNLEKVQKVVIGENVIKHKNFLEQFKVEDTDESSDLYWMQIDKKIVFSKALDDYIGEDVEIFGEFKPVVPTYKMTTDAPAEFLQLVALRLALTLVESDIFRVPFSYLYENFNSGDFVDYYHVRKLVNYLRQKVSDYEVVAMQKSNCRWQIDQK